VARGGDYAPPAAPDSQARTTFAHTGGFTMFLLRWALLFLVVAVIAAVFGYGGVAEGATDIARVLFFIFVTIFVLLLIAGAATYRAVAGPGDGV
jgi:uncharacterized membrane protein YtjA (UPF0391 family)